MCVQGEIVETAVGKSVPVVWVMSVDPLNLGNWVDITFRILHPCNEIGFRERRYAFVNPASSAEATELGD